MFRPAQIMVNDTAGTVLGTALHLMPGKMTEPNVWHMKQVAGIPEDAFSVFLSGLLIITHGISSETGDLTLAFRVPGGADTADFLYVGQCVEAHVGGGQRSHFASWVPCSKGAIEYQYRTSTPNDWPNHCAYGITLSAQAFAQ